MEIGRALGQVAQPPQLLLPDDRVADEDVFDPAARHHLRLAELRHLNADGARLDLQPGDLGQLVRLRVRTNATPASAAIAAIRVTFARTVSRSSTTSGVSSTSSARAATRSSSAGSAAMVFTAALYLLTPVCPGVEPRTIRVFVAVTPALRRIVSITRLR